MALGQPDNGAIISLASGETKQYGWGTDPSNVALAQVLPASDYTTVHQTHHDGINSGVAWEMYMDGNSVEYHVHNYEGQREDVYIHEYLE